MFSTDLLGLAPKRDVDYAIDFELDNNPIFVPPIRLPLLSLKSFTFGYRVF